jgi:hypothetical protein
MANPDICLSRKAARGPGYLEQCPNKKRPDTNYCGKHITSHIDYIANDTNVIRPINPPKEYTNTTDFYTLDDILNIPKEYLYDYEESGLLYAFDIRTLYDYLESCNPLEGYKNPYTQISIPQERVEEIKKAYKKLQKNGADVNGYKEHIDMEPQKALEWRCLSVFQKINELGHYTDYKWFWNLNLQQLKRMYIELEDLWNYRFGLTAVQKQNILPKYRPFRNVTLQQFTLFTDINEARTIFIDEIDKFISLGKLEGTNGNDKKYFGSLIVLTSLVIVSPVAAKLMPHLIPM